MEKHHMQILSNIERKNTSNIERKLSENETKKKQRYLKKWKKVNEILKF